MAVDDTKNAPRRVSATEAHALIRDEGFVYVDVRSQAEVDAGCPDDAYHVPFALADAHGMHDNPIFIAVMRGNFALDDKLVIGCATGVRSLRAVQQLLAAGFVNVVDQRAGFLGAKDVFGRTTEAGWSALGLPVSHDIDDARSYCVLSQRKKAT